MLQLASFVPYWFPRSDIAKINALGILSECLSIFLVPGAGQRTNASSFPGFQRTSCVERHTQYVENLGTRMRTNE